MVSDTLAERLATQVVKNLQLTIEKIHIRYEDKYTNPEKPFAAGVTLESLQFEVGTLRQRPLHPGSPNAPSISRCLQTTDSDFKRTIQTEAIKLFHKLVSMKSLAIYLNTRAAMISECPEDDRKRALLQSTIATEEKKLDTFSYREFLSHAPGVTPSPNLTPLV
jgi:vacuolar protein sorting-associated protein 13A/C